MPNISLNNNNNSNRPLTMNRCKNNLYFPINQVSNFNYNNLNVMLGSINNEKNRASSSLIKEKTKIILPESNKRDAVTQTEEIFFRM